MSSTRYSAAAVVPLSLALPSWDVAILPAAAPLAPSVSAAAPAHPSAPTAASAAVVDSPLTTATAAGISPVALIWSAGVLVTGGFLLIGVVRLKRVASRAERIAAGPWISHARLIAAEYRLPRSVAILQTDVRGLLGKRFSKRMVNIVALGSTASAFAYALWVALQFRALETVPHIGTYATWLRSGQFSVEYGFYLDQLALVMLLVVTGVGFLIHVYSVGYMEHEGGYYRFFSYMNLFMFCDSLVFDM